MGSSVESTDATRGLSYTKQINRMRSFRIVSYKTEFGEKQSYLMIIKNSISNFLNFYPSVHGSSYTDSFHWEVKESSTLPNPLIFKN